MKTKKLPLLLCSLALITAFTGCADKESVKPASKEPVVTTRITQSGNVGEKAQIGGVEVTVNGAYSSEYTGAVNDIPTRVLFFDVTVTNNTEEDVNANMLTSYEFEVDGEYFDSATLYAISCSKKQYGDDVNLFTETLKPGDSQTGYIAAEIPAEFQNLELFCLPLGGAKESYDPSQAITYSFTKYDLTEIKRPPISMD
jgi:hypothetical protein